MLLFFGLLIAFTASIFLMVLIAKLIFDRNSANEIIGRHSSAPPQKSWLAVKYAEANIDHYRTLFLNIGLILSLAFVILAFQWTSYDKPVKPEGSQVTIEETEIIPPQSKRNDPEPPPPPVMQVKLNMPPDNIIIDDEPNFALDDIDESTNISSPASFATEDEKVDEPEIFLPGQLEEWPQFQGGEQGLREFLGKTKYPEDAKWMELEGTVYVSFIIDEKGKVTNVEAVRGPHKILNDAAVERVKSMPDWTPGRQHGKPVKVKYNVPIRFTFG